MMCTLCLTKLASDNWPATNTKNQGMNEFYINVTRTASLDKAKLTYVTIHHVHTQTRTQPFRPQIILACSINRSL